MNDILNHKVRFFFFCLYLFFFTSPSLQFSQAQIAVSDVIDEPLLTVDFCLTVLQLREYCLRLRNMVASDATKAELSDAIDTMIEEVRLREHT